MNKRWQTGGYSARLRRYAHASLYTCVCGCVKPLHDDFYIMEKMPVYGGCPEMDCAEIYGQKSVGSWCWELVMVMVTMMLMLMLMMMMMMMKLMMDD